MEPYLGEIRCFSFGRIPTGWLPCAGQTLLITQYSALYSLIGIEFGGDARTTFRLPDLRGMVPLQYNPAAHINVGTTGGVETVTLTQTQMPSHTHLVATNSDPGTTTNPTGDFLASVASPHLAFNTGTSLVATAADNVGSTGGSGPHSNMQPSLAVSFCIAVSGYYPPRP